MPAPVPARTMRTARDKVPDCVRLTPDNVRTLSWLPPSCGYRLVAEGRDLYWWHPLISGDPDTVHEAGVSVRGRVQGSGDEIPAERARRSHRAMAGIVAEAGAAEAAAEGVIFFRCWQDPTYLARTCLRDLRGMLPCAGPGAARRVYLLKCFRDNDSPRVARASETNIIPDERFRTAEPSICRAGQFVRQIAEEISHIPTEVIDIGDAPPLGAAGAARARMRCAPSS